MERRRGTRVEGLVLRPDERGAPAAGAAEAARGPGAGHATLWAGDPAITGNLRFNLAAFDITLEEADSAEALLDAAPHSIFLAIDCATGTDALARCRAVLPRATRPMLICHPDKDFVDDLQPAASGALTWVPPEWLGSRLRDKLALLVSPPAAPPVAPRQALGEPLSAREEEVRRLIAAGRTNKEIAARLGVTLNTVKSHVSHAMQKLGVSTREELVKAGEGQV